MSWSRSAWTETPVAVGCDAAHSRPAQPPPAESAQTTAGPSVLTGDPSGPAGVPMTRHRAAVRLCAVLAALASAKGCGDGESPTATPDAPRPTTLAVSPPTAELTTFGATVQLAAEVRDQNVEVAAAATAAWASSSPAVATVDGSGLVTAARNGEATITANAGSASGSTVVTVTQSVTSMTMQSAAELHALGDTVQLTPEALVSTCVRSTRGSGGVHRASRGRSRRFPGCGARPLFPTAAGRPTGWD